MTKFKFIAKIEGDCVVPFYQQHDAYTELTCAAVQKDQQLFDDILAAHKEWQDRAEQAMMVVLEHTDGHDRIYTESDDILGCRFKTADFRSVRRWCNSAHITVVYMPAAARLSPFFYLAPTDDAQRALIHSRWIDA